MSISKCRCYPANDETCKVKILTRELKDEQNQRARFRLRNNLRLAIARCQCDNKPKNY